MGWRAPRTCRPVRRSPSGTAWAGWPTSAPTAKARCALRPTASSSRCSMRCSPGARCWRRRPWPAAVSATGETDRAAGQPGRRVAECEPPHRAIAMHSSDDEDELFASQALVEAIESQLESGEPPATQAVYNKLNLVGYEREEILQMMAIVL